MFSVSRARKAYVAAAGSAGPLLAALADGGVTLAEVGAVVGAFVGVFVVVYAVPNRAEDVVRPQ